MNDLIIRNTVRDLFDAMGQAGLLDGYSRDDVMNWTLEVTTELFTGESTVEQIRLEIAALEVD